MNEDTSAASSRKSDGSSGTPSAPPPSREDRTLPVSKGGLKAESILGSLKQYLGFWGLTPSDKAKHDAFWNEKAEREQREAKEAEARRVADIAALAAREAAEDRDEYKTLLEDEDFQINKKRRWAAVICNVKGGAAKTPVTCNLASVHGFTTRRVTTVVDNNPNWGTTALLLGIDTDETVSVRQMHASIERGGIVDFSSFSAPLGSNRFNVQLVASDEMAQRNTYGYELAKSVISTARANSIFVLNDTGNEISNEAMMAALELSDVLIIPTLTTRAKLGGAVSTMKNFTEWGYGDMVRHSIVVVNGLRPGESAEDYRARLQLDDDHILLGIPWDESIHNDEVINVNFMPLDTLIAYLELAVAVSKVAKYVSSHGRDGAPLKLVQGKLVNLPSGRTPVLSYVRPIQQNHETHASNGQQALTGTHSPMALTTGSAPSVD